MAQEFAGGADADLQAGFSGGTGSTSSTTTAPTSTTPPTTETPTEGTEEPEDPTVKAILDAWESGKPVTQGDANTQTSVPPVDMSNPIVRKLIEDRTNQERQTQMAEVARALASSGAIDRRAIPEFMDFLAGVQQMKNEYDSMREFLGKLDRSELVLSANVNKLAKKYGRYGVTAEDLQVAARPESSAQELETVARTLAIIKRRQSTSDRAKNGSDSVENTRGRGGNVSADYMDLTKSADDLLRSGLRR